ncbi:Pyruvate kinase, cytosolic isozyme [Dichanthelium oligosanthes]|uniref:Pyruvate kinase n=1 Tax=Dichanthelium oligosanthes TaxID=888268 RepID=A0A1E5VNX4_9POAL|nr:Pyruvate kinase, cytosolic isozyme [Dichanthelium oligosanthes]
MAAAAGGEQLAAWGEEPVLGRRPKTKIVCTLGPASRSVEMISRLLRAGMCVARFNFSHGSHEYHQETLDNLRAAMERTGILCAVMLDTKVGPSPLAPFSISAVARLVLQFAICDFGVGLPCRLLHLVPLRDLDLRCDLWFLISAPPLFGRFCGPEIRTGFLKDGKPVQLKKGQEITISTDYSIKGDEKMISMSYKKLAVDLKPGSVILCADGTITLTVLHCDKEQGFVRARCENTSMLGERKNVNLPGVIVDLPTLTDKDKEDILKWGVPNKIDMIALSFVRKGSDLVEVRKVLGEHAKSIMLMSKVENQEGVANFDDILAHSDAFMVARGDLGMEIPIEKIFFAQKVMIFKCNIQGKPVVTATQMLESMIKSPRPTRAEATDVANAVLDGTDCVMLSGETAAGAYPELAVQTMAKICLQAESCVDHAAVFKYIMASAPIPMSPLESLASSAVRTANSAKAALILVLTRGGTTARLVAKYRPFMPILSVVVPELKTDSFDWTCSDEGPARQSLIVRGVIPMLSATTAKAFDSEATEEALGFAIENAKAMGLCNTGESVVALHRIGIASVIKLLTVN